MTATTIKFLHSKSMITTAEAAEAIAKVIGCVNPHPAHISNLVCLGRAAGTGTGFVYDGGPLPPKALEGWFEYSCELIDDEREG